MKPLTSAAAMIAVGLALAACAGETSSGNAARTTVSHPGSKPVAARQISGIGRILVAADGNAVYMNDQERNSAVLCNAGCTAFWKPVEPGAGKSPQTLSAAKLSVIQRSDGTTQLTTNGKPLYTFSEDSPGTVKGNNFTDDFGGHHFTWHVVRLGAAANTASSGGNATRGANITPPAAIPGTSASWSSKHDSANDIRSLGVRIVTRPPSRLSEQKRSSMASPMSSCTTSSSGGPAGAARERRRARRVDLGAGADQR